MADVIIKGNSKYFDFRSVSELIDKGNRILDSENPFLILKGTRNLKYLDTLSAIRNCVVHNSETSIKTYKNSLKTNFDIKSSPEPNEFLNAIDYRQTSPLRGQKRLLVLSKIVKDSIKII